MFYKDFIQSITILSLLQLVFSERSANNVYSYLCPHHASSSSSSSPSSPPLQTTRMIDIGTAFTLFRNPVSQKLCSKSTSSYGMTIGDPRGFPRTGGGGSPWKAPSTPAMIGKQRYHSMDRRTTTTTQRHLFSFNLKEMVKGTMTTTTTTTMTTNPKSSSPEKGKRGTTVKKESTKREGEEETNDTSVHTNTNMKESKKDISTPKPWKTMVTKYKNKRKIRKERKARKELENEKEEIDEKKDQNVQTKLRSSFSLSSLINVEALLLASGQVELDDEDIMNGKQTTILDTENKLSTREGSSSIGSSTSSSTSSITTLTNNASSTTTLPPTSSSSSTSSINIQNAEEQLSWKALTKTFQQNIRDIVVSPADAAEAALREATQSIEELYDTTIQSLIVTTSRSSLGLASVATSAADVDQNADAFKETMDRVVAAAESLAREQGVDVSDAAMYARETTKQTAEFLHVANGVLVSGYVRSTDDDTYDDDDDDDTYDDDTYDGTGKYNTRNYFDIQQQKQRNKDLAEIWNIPTSDETNENAKPLFDNYDSVEAITFGEYTSVIQKGAEMSLLSGAIYQDTVKKTHEIDHSIVANGTTADVAWMVTDNIAYEQDFKESEQELTKKESSPMLVRTITIRGYDASDETVDREKLLAQICNAAPVPLGDDVINVHRGLLQVAKAIYKDVLKYIDMTGPNHKIVLNGHSIGGSLSLMILFLLTQERGADYVNKKIERVFTFGSPPIATLMNSNLELKNSDSNDCTILKALELRSDMVYGYIQPWDPIVRMFSRIDPLYPLVGDLGEDGVSLYASGPPRTLRPILKALFEIWEDWPTFRDNYRFVMNQEYLNTGIQHIFLPDIGRYLTDRLISVNIATFPIEEMVRISPKDLYSALEETFPLDTFSISLVPTAIRSFIHHFYPAYTDFADYAEKKKNDINYFYSEK